MMAPHDSESPDRKYEVLAQEVIDYDIRGSRHWSDLKGSEQDDYIWACFVGESGRAAAEERLQLLDRIAGTVADNLLGPFRQLDVADGHAHYQPENAARVERVLWLRMTALKGTSLGDRLSVALRRRRSQPEEISYADDPKLLFEYLDFRRTRGLEIMAEESFGGYAGVDPYRGAWNDWAALELQQAKEIQQSRPERWKQEIAAPAVSRSASTKLDVSSRPMSDFLSRLFAILLMLWLPFSFFVPPALLLLGIYLFRFGWLGILGGLGAIAVALPLGLTILLLEFRTLGQRPINIWRTILVVIYNTAILLAFRLLL